MNDNTMTAQQVFDKVVKHLLTQNQKARDKNYGICHYLTEDGLKCAVGCLIPSDEYSSQIECKTLYELLSNAYKKVCPPSLKALSAHQVLLGELQSIHDIEAVKNWTRKLQALAKKRNLQFNPPK